MKWLNKHIFFHLLCFSGFGLAYFNLIYPFVDCVFIPYFTNGHVYFEGAMYSIYLFLSVLGKTYLTCLCILIFAIAILVETVIRFLLKKFFHLERNLNFNKNKTYTVIQKLGFLSLFLYLIIAGSFYFIGGLYALLGIYHVDNIFGNDVLNDLSYAFLFTHVFATKLFKNPNDNWS